MLQKHADTWCKAVEAEKVAKAQEKERKLKAALAAKREPSNSTSGNDSSPEAPEDKMDIDASISAEESMERNDDKVGTYVDHDVRIGIDAIT